MSNLEQYLAGLTEQDWLSAIDSLLPDIHKVDRNAVQIWFRFYPLELRSFLEQAEDKEEIKQKLQLLGDFDLAEQIDTSHRFLYGHRYWPKVKETIEEEAENGEDAPYSDLAHLVKELSMQVSERTSDERPVDRSLLNGIIAVGLMTLNQVGLEKFKAAKGEVEKPKGIMAKSPGQIVAERKQDDSQGLLGFLRTVDKRFSIAWTDKLSTGKFRIINDEEIASASARDQSQNWRERDPRCWEGVVPVECRSASCGTCWIGVLGGKEKLSEVGRRERRQMKVFGYQQPEDEKPFLRLACQAKAYGNATIVIPPWNGVFGKQVYGNVEELELEPVTTSAQKLRETLASVGSEDEQ
jgi:ferredoxin